MENLKNQSKDRKPLGIRIVDTINTIIDISLVIIFLLMLVFGCYAMWDNNQIISSGNSARYTTYKPTTEDSKSFEELQKINDDVFAWVSVYGTEIDYPVVQGVDNNEYLNKSAEGEFSMAGSIYLDSLNKKDFKDFNSIIYGHHMAESAMFGDLDNFLEQSYFDTHRYGNLYFNDKDHGLEFFAFIETDAYNGSIYRPPIAGDDEKTKYLSYLVSIAQYTRDIDIASTDRIVLLSTCASDLTNGRYILVGRITDEVYDNTFVDSEDINSGSKDSFFSRSFLLNLPIWFWIIIVLLIILVPIIWKKHNQKENEEVREERDKKHANEK